MKTEYRCPCCGSEVNKQLWGLVSLRLACSICGLTCDQVAFRVANGVTKHEAWSQAIATRIADELPPDYDEDRALIRRILAAALALAPAAFSEALIGTAVIEENYFDDAMLPPPPHEIVTQVEDPDDADYS